MQHKDLIEKCYLLLVEISLSNSSFLIYDHFGTATLEFLDSNKPFLIYLKIENYSLSNEGIKIFNFLKKVGILHENHESLIKMITYLDNNNISEWWNQKDRLIIINYIKKNYAYISANPINEWVEAINKFTQ